MKQMYATKAVIFGPSVYTVLFKYFFSYFVADGDSVFANSGWDGRVLSSSLLQFDRAIIRFVYLLLTISRQLFPIF